MLRWGPLGESCNVIYSHLRCGIDGMSHPSPPPQKKEAVKEQLRREGHPIPRTDPVKGWDSNVITPGTPFMDKVARSVRFYVQKKISSDPGWKNVCVCVCVFFLLILPPCPRHFCFADQFWR